MGTKPHFDSAEPNWVSDRSETLIIKMSSKTSHEYTFYAETWINYASFSHRRDDTVYRHVFSTTGFGLWDSAYLSKTFRPTVYNDDVQIICKRSMKKKVVFYFAKHMGIISKEIPAINEV